VTDTAAQIATAKDLLAEFEEGQALQAQRATNLAAAVRAIVLGPPTRTLAAGWGDGVKDATGAIQMEIDALAVGGGVVVIPAGYSFRVSTDPARCIKLKTGVTLQLDGNLVGIPNGLERSYGVLIDGQKDVTIRGVGRFIGDRLLHTYSGTSTHEWGMGVAVYGSQNVTVEGVIVAECTGDGIVVGRDSSDVTISNVVSTHNRRQGLTIGRAKTVKVYDSEFSFTGTLNGQPGAEPKDGIDIEPDSTGSALCEDVLIQGCRIADNESAGIETMAVTAQVRNVRIIGCEIARNSDGGHFQKCQGIVLADNEVHDNRGYGIKLLNTTTTALPITGNVFQRNLLRAGNFTRTAELVDDGLVSARDLKVEATAGACVAGENTYR
jgi:polygalacturonase